MTKENIILAALRLFLLRGYRNVSLIDVANEVGITKGGIYHYFGSKEDLLLTAIYQLFDRFGAKCDELFDSEKSCWEILNAVMVQRELDNHMENLLNIKSGDYRANRAGLALEMMHNFPELQERIDNSNIQFRNVIEKMLLKAQQQGEIKEDQNAFALASMIVCILSGQNVLGKVMDSPDMRQQMLESLWQVIGCSASKK